MCAILKAMDNVLHIPLEDPEKEVFQFPAKFLTLLHKKVKFIGYLRRHF